MIRQRVILSINSLLITLACGGAVFAEEPPCAANFRTDGKSAETFVLTTLTPQAVVETLPYRLAKNGITMQWSQPDKGIIKALEMDINATTSGESTRVTFRSSLNPPMDEKTLCRYASLVGGAPVKKNPPPTQDPVLIARMKDDLLKKHQIVAVTGAGRLDNAEFTSLSTFLDFSITDVKPSPGKVEYEISMLLPRSACKIAREDLSFLSASMTGGKVQLPTKPVRVKALLVYEGEGTTLHLSDATIETIESTE